MTSAARKVSTDALAVSDWQPQVGELCEGIVAPGVNAAGQKFRGRLHRFEKILGNVEAALHSDDGAAWVIPASLRRVAQEPAPGEIPFKVGDWVEWTDSAGRRVASWLTSGDNGYDKAQPVGTTGDLYSIWVKRTALTKWQPQPGELCEGVAVSGIRRGGEFDGFDPCGDARLAVGDGQFWHVSGASLRPARSEDVPTPTGSVETATREGAAGSAGNDAADASSTQPAEPERYTCPRTGATYDLAAWGIPAASRAPRAAHGPQCRECWQETTGSTNYDGTPICHDCCGDLCAEALGNGEPREALDKRIAAARPREEAGKGSVSPWDSEDADELFATHGSGR